VAFAFDEQDDQDEWWLALLSEPLFTAPGILERAAGLRPAWQRRAACRGLPVAVFFPDPGEGAFDAKRVCAGCSVRAQCGQFALDRGEPFGVWGGLGTAQRRAQLQAG
jgi:hypothetical protein